MDKIKTSKPFPSHAKKVFEGIIFDVYHWNQKLFDGTTTTFEKLSRVDTVQTVAITEDNKIIMLKQEQPNKPPFTSLPGGRSEKGEDPKLAAKRELLEETGYECSEIKLWQITQPVLKIDWTIYTFIAKGCRKIKDLNLDGGEKIEPFLLSIDDYVDIVLSRNHYTDSILDKFIDQGLVTLRSDKKKIKNLFL